MSVWLATVVFVITYVSLAFPRAPVLPVGRPATALLGAVLMVALGALTPEAAYRAIDGNTLVLLVALMMLAGALEHAGMFARMTSLAERHTPRGLLTALVFVSGGLSAVLLNDTVCLFLTPVVCSVCVQRGLPLAPYLLALATSSNIGSAATLVGNPQNILIGSIGPLDFIGYLRIAGPAALAGLVVNAILLQVAFGRTLASVEPRAPRAESIMPIARAPLWVGVAVAVGYAAGLHLAFVTLAGVVLLIVLARREPLHLFASVDWPLIVFFSALFVVVEGFAATGLPQTAWQLAAPHLALHGASGVAAFSAYTVIGSNLFSNVPLVMLLGPLVPELGNPERGFALLGFVSTVAGNLTLLGSVANLIVAERARQHHELGFWEYLRFGVVSTALVLAVGVPIICLLR
ncbi:MAG: SLC13 family permease [Polyangiales bacterium]